MSHPVCRSVEEQERPFALGMQFVLLRTLGELQTLITSSGLSVSVRSDQVSGPNLVFVSLIYTLLKARMFFLESLSAKGNTDVIFVFRSAAVMQISQRPETRCWLKKKRKMLKNSA